MFLGVIDTGYRRPVKVLLQNLGTTDVIIEQEYRITLNKCEQVITPTIAEITSLTIITRDTDGCGSSEEYNTNKMCIVNPPNISIDTNSHVHIILMCVEDDIVPNTSSYQDK